MAGGGGCLPFALLGLEAPCGSKTAAVAGKKPQKNENQKPTLNPKSTLLALIIASRAGNGVGWGWQGCSRPGEGPGAGPGGARAVPLCRCPVDTSAGTDPGFWGDSPLCCSRVGSYITRCVFSTIAAFHCGSWVKTGVIFFLPPSLSNKKVNF